MAFHSLKDYENKTVAYSDVNDLVDIADYKMDIDLRTPKSKLGLKTTVGMNARFPDLRAVPFFIGESLGKSGNQRLKKTNAFEIRAFGCDGIGSSAGRLGKRRHRLSARSDANRPKARNLFRV
jgi:hypothetical protein